MSCININHPAVLALAEELGKSNFIIGGMIDVWQTKHNQDKIPTAEELDNDVVLDSVSIEDREGIETKQKSNLTSSEIRKSPNGKPSNLTEKQWEQVRSKKFKEWFGDWENNPKSSSVVLDENGEPMVLFHGTGEKFTEFDHKKIGSNGSALGFGFYFTDSKDVASGYSNNLIPVMEVFLNSKKPLNINAKKFNKQDIEKLVRRIKDLEIELYNNEIKDYKDSFLSNIADTYSVSESRAIKEAVDMLFEGNDKAVDIISELSIIVGSKEIVNRAVFESLGYDSIVDNNFQNNGDAVYVSLLPNAIKSATDNRGSFSNKFRDIRFQMVGSSNNIPLKSFAEQVKLNKANQKTFKFILSQFSKIADNVIVHDSIEDWNNIVKAEIGDKADSMGGFYATDDFGKIHILLNPYLATDETLIHELIHAFTQVILDNPTTKTEKEYVKTIKTLFEKAKNIKEVQEFLDGYVFKDISEFITYSMTNEEFQNILNKNEGTKTLWQKILNFIQNLFGIENKAMVEKVISSTENIITNTEYSNIQQRILDNESNTPKGHLTNNLTYEQVEKLFDENPKIANQVYEELGFNDGVVLYHGTSGILNGELDTSRSNTNEAIFLTENEIFANQFSFEDENRPNGVTYKIKVNVKNTFDSNSEEKMKELEPLIREMVKDNYKYKTGLNYKTDLKQINIGNRVIDNPTIEDFVQHYLWRGKGNFRLMETPVVVEYLKSKGYDSFSITERGQKNIAVFDSKNLTPLSYKDKNGKETKLSYITPSQKQQAIEYYIEKQKGETQYQKVTIPHQEAIEKELTPTQKENIANLKQEDARWQKYSDEDIQRFIENNNDINSNKALQDMEEFMRGDNPITKEDFDLILKNTPNINPELNRDGVNIDDVTFTNEEGEICLESGGVFNNVIDKPSNSWRILTEFKGRTHSEGGIDISLDENGITFSDESTALKAKNGMVIDYFDLISVIK